MDFSKRNIERAFYNGEICIMKKRLGPLMLFLLIFICTSCLADENLILNKEYRILGGSNYGTIIKFSKSLAVLSGMGYKYSIKDDTVLVETPFGIQLWEIIDKGVLKNNNDYFAVIDENDFIDSSKFSKELIGVWKSEKYSMAFEEDGTYIEKWNDSSFENYKIFVASDKIIIIEGAGAGGIEEYYYKITNGILYLNDDAFVKEKH